MNEIDATCYTPDAVGEVIDAHQHFWDIDQNYIPWLSDHELIEFRYGDYCAIRRNYLPADFRRDVAGLPMAATVCIEAEWPRGAGLGEVHWLTDLVAREGLNSVIVAQARLDSRDIEYELEGLAAKHLVRGVRHKPCAAKAPHLVELGTPGSMSDPAWIEGFARLAENGLSFDLQVPWWHLGEARRLADEHPNTQIILNHTGLPADRSAEGILGWRSAMTDFAMAENAAVKISGLGIPGRPWRREDNKAIVRDTIAIFGTHRCMFASNFPVDSLVGGYRTIMEGFAGIVSDCSPQERHALFSENARRIYRIGKARNGEAQS